MFRISPAILLGLTSICLAQVSNQQKIERDNGGDTNHTTITRRHRTDRMIFPHISEPSEIIGRNQWLVA